LAESPTEEKFAQNGGHVVAVLGTLVVVAMVVGWALDPDEVGLWVLALAFVLALLIWTSTLRPRVLVQGSSLVMRNMLSTVRIPLAAVEEIAVRQVMAVRAGDKRYVCAGVGRTLRQAMKGSAVQRAREQMGGLRGEVATIVEPGMVYADYVEVRVRQLAGEDLARRGIRSPSPEVEELGAHVRREPAWPEISLLVVAVALFVIAVLVG
jgi:hypothetical protein